jgi:hypothetical protein
VEDQSDVTALATGDVDADGHLDLVALTGYGETWVFTGDGKGSFTRQKAAPPAYPGACSGYHVRLADLDGRPGDEIVASFAGEGNALFSTGIALPGIKDRSCPTQGGFQAWRAVAAKAAAH